MALELLWVGDYLQEVVIQSVTRRWRSHVTYSKKFLLFNIFDTKPNQKELVAIFLQSPKKFFGFHKPLLSIGNN